MAISKIILNGVTQIDLTQDTVATGNLISPNTAHGADGEAIVGTASGGGSVTITDEANATGTTCVITTGAEPSPTPSGTWETVYEASTNVSPDTPYGYFYISTLANVPISVDSYWRITLDGATYLLTAKQYGNDVVLGNPKWNEGTDDGTNIPFCLFNNNYAWLGGTSLPANVYYPLKIERQVSE